jgi:hypothetical protein|nr:MAG TPA: dUTPase [Ackermannviridae sp.]
MKKIDYTLLDGQTYQLEFKSGYGHSVGIDVALAENVELHYGEFKICSLGFTMKVPDGYKADLKPRSSTFKTWGVLQANSIGLFEPSYSSTLDKWAIPLFRPLDYKAMQRLSNGDKSLSDDVLIIPKGTRIGQIEIFKAQDEVELNLMSNEEYAKKHPNVRGGFGSTGVK